MKYNPTVYNSYHSNTLAEKHASCVKNLLSAGAHCVGKTVMSEFARNLTGINHFYGIPKNPKSPDRIPGGSSSGSASVVAGGLVDFALGTDTGGSIRVPAGYCGIYGMRPSTGSLSLNGIRPLSPSFDTIGAFSATADILYKVINVLLPSNHSNLNANMGKIYFSQDAMDLIDREVREIYLSALDILNKEIITKSTSNELIDSNVNHIEHGWSATFLNIISSEIWDTLGPWITNINLEFKKVLILIL